MVRIDEDTNELIYTPNEKRISPTRRKLTVDDAIKDNTTFE